MFFRAWYKFRGILTHSTQQIRLRQNKKKPWPERKGCGIHTYVRYHPRGTTVSVGRCLIAKAVEFSSIDPFCFPFVLMIPGRTLQRGLNTGMPSGRHGSKAGTVNRPISDTTTNWLPTGELIRRINGARCCPPYLLPIRIC